jgi:hypothetical protein
MTNHQEPQQQPEDTATGRRITIEKPRSIVQKATAGDDGYDIVDTTGKDQPYRINAMDTLSDYERNRLSSVSVQRYEAHSRRVAEDWASVWNIVELGHCGACQKLLAEDPGHKNERYSAVGYNHLYRTICFACACSQED